MRISRGITPTLASACIGNRWVGFHVFISIALSSPFPPTCVELTDPAFPAEASLYAFSPFIPCNDFDSSLPAAFFEVTLLNTGEQPLVYDIALSLCNPHATLCENRSVDSGDVHKLLLGSPNKREGLCAAVIGKKACVQDYWYRGTWFDDINIFRKNLSDGDTLPAREYGPDERRGYDHGTLMTGLRCRPGETVTTRFVITWYYPIQQIDLADRSILGQFDDHKQTIVGGDIHQIYWNPEIGEINYQIGQGSAIDQVASQRHASLMGLGELFDRERFVRPCAPSTNTTTPGVSTIRSTPAVCIASVRSGER